MLFKGFNTTDAVNTISLLCGFLVIFAGVHLLNLSRGDPDGHKLGLHTSKDITTNGIPTDGIASLQTRRSMQAHRSLDRERRRLSSGSISYSAHPGDRGDREGLIHAYDEENGNGGFGLSDLTEEESDDERRGKGKRFGRGSGEGRLNGSHVKRPDR